MLQREQEQSVLLYFLNFAVDRFKHLKLPMNVSF